MKLRIPLGSGLAILLGAALGLGLYTFIYAKGASYLTDDPSACANCHIMGDHFAGWVKSSHARVAVCNDCHTPSGFVSKYTVKASNGFWHSFAFTTGWFHDPLQIKSRNHGVTEAACRKCHLEILAAMDAGQGDEDQVACIRCHRSVGHLQ